jgi:signal transduction histidine kinase
MNQWADLNMSSSIDTTESKGSVHRLTLANYVPRAVGFAAAFLMIAFVIIYRGWTLWNLVGLGLFCFIYPHVVYLASKYSANGRRVEHFAMMFDSLMLGFWTAHIQFVFWIAYTFLTATLLNNIIVGGLRQLVKALVLFAAGVIGWSAIVGFQFRPEAPFFIEFLAMAMLMLYVGSVAFTFYNLNVKLMKIKRQQEVKNRQLEETLHELDQTRDELVEKAHKAGMADIATGVLHNVGNVLNSVNTSASLIRRAVEGSKLEGFVKANSILRQHNENREEFLTTTPKGKKLIEYYLQLEKPLQAEQSEVLQQSKRLGEKISLINEVISAQQSFAGAGNYTDQTSLSKMIDDALSLQAGSIERHGLNLTRNLRATAPVMVQKSKLIHVLVNLFKNAKESMETNHPENKDLIIETWQDRENVFLSVTDNGAGVDNEHIQKIFTHAFTTKKGGHGFGLHSSANYMNEMGGTITVKSDGVGKGATFTLTFPRAVPDDERSGKQQYDAA